MQKIVPFKQDITFNNNIKEIISISLDHEFSIEANKIKGNFKISGEYKKLETSINNEPFNYNLPFLVDLDEKYILDNIKVDVDDFYYEVFENNILRVGIDVLIDNVEEKERCIEEEIKEDYKNYIVYIVREEDTIEKIISEYKIKKESLEEYNDLSSIKPGDKIIIPS